MKVVPSTHLRLREVPDLQRPVSRARHADVLVVLTPRHVEERVVPVERLDDVDPGGAGVQEEQRPATWRSVSKCLKWRTDTVESWSLDLKLGYSARGLVKLQHLSFKCVNVTSIRV